MKDWKTYAIFILFCCVAYLLFRQQTTVVVTELPCVDMEARAVISVLGYQWSPDGAFKKSISDAQKDFSNLVRMYSDPVYSKKVNLEIAEKEAAEIQKRQQQFFEQFSKELKEKKNKK